jgi:hypothetical protein
MTDQPRSRDPRLVGALFALALDAALLTFAVLLLVASVSAATGLVLTGTAGLVVAPFLGWRYGRRAASLAGDGWSVDRFGCFRRSSRMMRQASGRSRHLGGYGGDRGVAAHLLDSPGRVGRRMGTGRTIAPSTLEVLGWSDTACPGARRSGGPAGDLSGLRSPLGARLPDRLRRVVPPGRGRDLPRFRRNGALHRPLDAVGSSGSSRRSEQASQDGRRSSPGLPASPRDPALGDPTAQPRERPDRPT